MADTRVLFDIVGRDKASPAFKSAGGSADRLKSALGGVAKIAGGTLVAAFGKSAVEAFSEAEKAQNQLTASFAKSPALVGANIKAIQDLNSQLARKTKFDDDATASGQAVLAGFNLTAEQITTLTPLLQDYATRTGKDLPTAAQTLGKAILGQGRALKGIGLDFKDTGSQAGNFGQLVDGLRSKVGGFAEKEGKTAGGRLEIMRNQFGELQEAVGQRLVPALTALATGLTSVFSWFADLNPAVQTGIGVAAGLAAAAFVLVKATQAWTAAQAALNVVLSANPIGLVVLALAALVTALVLAYQRSETFRDVVKGVFAVVADKVLGALEWITKAAAAAFGWVPGLGPGLKEAAKNVEAFRDRVNAALRGIDPPPPIVVVPPDFAGPLLPGEVRAPKVVAPGTVGPLLPGQTVAQGPPSPNPVTAPGPVVPVQDPNPRHAFSLVVNNPVGEPTEDSVARELRRLSYLGVF